MINFEKLHNSDLYLMFGFEMFLFTGTFFILTEAETVLHYNLTFYFSSIKNCQQCHCLQPVTYFDRVIEE